MARTSRKRRRARGLSEAAMPSLNSLMDVVTIILVYFVKTFAVSPITVQDPSVQLPISTARETPEEAIVVMITGDKRRETNSVGDSVLVADMPTISVDDDLILHLKPNFEIPKGELEGQFVIKTLKKRLLEVRKLQGVTAELTSSKEEPDSKIVFVVDRHVPYSTLSKALVSSSEAGYADFKFAIVKREG